MRTTKTAAIFFFFAATTAVLACGSSSSTSSTSGDPNGNDKGPADCATGLCKGAPAPDGGTTDGATPDGGAGVCPATQPKGSDQTTRSACTMGQDNTQRFANCSYGATCCTCQIAQSCGGDALWVCSDTQAAEPCPVTLPAPGDACTPGGPRCVYCTPNGLFEAVCNGSSASSGTFVVQAPSLACSG